MAGWDDGAAAALWSAGACWSTGGCWAAGGCDWSGLACGGELGDCKPSAAGLASAGIRGVAVLREGVGPEGPLPDVVLPPAARAALSERPGAMPETSAATPALKPAAPIRTQRRARLTRCSAASRSSWASEVPRTAGVCFPLPLMSNTIREGNQRSVSAA